MVTPPVLQMLTQSLTPDVVTFDDGDVTELTANLIAESMYVQCDPDGNQYVLLDSIIDHRRLDTAIKLSDQTVVRNSGRKFK